MLTPEDRQEGERLCEEINKALDLVEIFWAGRSDYIRVAWIELMRAMEGIVTDVDENSPGIRTGLTDAFAQHLIWLGRAGLFTGKKGGAS